MRNKWTYAALAIGVAGCQGIDRDELAQASAGTGTSADSSSSEPSPQTSADGASTDSGENGSGSSTGFKFDLPPGATDGNDASGGEPMPSCTVTDDMDALSPCTDQAPPDSFEPDVQWSWSGTEAEPYSTVTPLVANLTDDDGSGTIDLCDIPDVVVVTYSEIFETPGHIHVLDGATGVPHFQIETAVDPSVTPALGDIDGDGLVEIVTATLHGAAVVAFEHDGTLKWSSPEPWGTFANLSAIALADLDNDGDVEIIAGNKIYDHTGALVAAAPESAGAWAASTAVDLDGDGDLEVVLSSGAFHHDGTPLWTTGHIGPGFPQVADLDGDGLPEVLYSRIDGLSLYEHDGTPVYEGLTPNGVSAGSSNWIRPAAIHDLDGDGEPEFAISSGDKFGVYEADASIVWAATVDDSSGIAAGTAFDFLGDGSAEAMYADEYHMFVFGPWGFQYLQTPRTSRTGIEYPTVADIDNDGSAEILVVSNESLYGESPSPTVQAIRDIDDRWIQARRIWNQHTYHVTNVREDGTIPQFEPPHWELLNTFRTNSQIEGGTLCQPDPEG